VDIVKEEAMSKKPDKGTDRRDFLKMAGLGTVAGGAALVVAKDEAKADEIGAAGQGYRETEHVSTYYKLARF
jgi:hypothetical protein